MEDVKMSAPMKSLLVVYSYHHNNTEKIADVIARVLDSQIKTPQQTDQEELHEYARTRVSVQRLQY
jgi:flavodoxin